MKKVRKVSARKSARKSAKPMARAKARVTRALKAGSRRRSSAHKTAKPAVVRKLASVRKPAAKRTRRRPRPMTTAHFVGDGIESAGKLIEQSGFLQLGKAIRKIGNAVEHIQDR